MSKQLQRVKVLEPKHPNQATKLFGGEASGILNWNNLKYPHWYKFRETLRGKFWRAGQINMTDDIKQYLKLSENERKAYDTIIGLLATLDGPQTDIALKMSLYATDPSVKSIMATIADQEAEHNHSYSYVLSSVMNFDRQMEVFNIGRVNPVLLERNERIMDVYNNFAKNTTIRTTLEAMVYSTLLEGLFFYSGFAFFYNLARNNKMVGTSTMISYINRDELEHGRYISELFRATLAENPEENTEEFVKWIYDHYHHSVEQEIKWSHYLLGEVEGIDLDEMEGFIKYRANKMLRLLGLDEIYPEFTENPMKWIRAYVDSFDDTKSDFFEQHNRQYNKNSGLNGFDDL